MKYIFYLILLLSACQNQSAEVKESALSYEPMRYTKMFGIAHFSDYSRLFFVKNGDTSWSVSSKEIDSSKYTIAVLSSVFAACLEIINEQKSIIALDKISYYNDSLILQKFSRGEIAEIGEEGQLKIEKLLQLKPDFLFASSHTSSDPATVKRLESAGTKIIPCDNFLEQDPLARAEWMKLFGFVCGKLPLACAKFNQVDSYYQLLKSQINTQRKRPVVMTDAMYMSVWNIPGAESYTAKLIQDAGAQYVFNDKKDRYSYPLSFETVYTTAANADVWIHVNQYKSISELLSAEPRYQLFHPVKNLQVYNYNKRENRNGGNDFWETGVVRPDLVLHDLIQIFSMDKNKQTNLYFYNRLD
ncbi:MAG: ABC transporter substrate-binding protein [Chitinophagaceae bacterium]